MLLPVRACSRCLTHGGGTLPSQSNVKMTLMAQIRLLRSRSQVKDANVIF